ncbi:hypothetical protein I3842_16G021000 [Carya illinoinensis]|uniref:Chalcone/stilbene synthase N-terminal domain-containing protein n=1 Tax=Carya illinoinensis TaxID=32201 RepID=A0A922D439_CARIL|nr:hypothetical protein I3842_16G021000 [Carya illinoinensis]
MASVEKIREAQRAHGLATILAIGTTNPANCIYQKDYPNFYFRVTKSEHMTELKEKFKRICKKSRIGKHYFHLKEILKANPNMCKCKAPSLNACQDIVVNEVPSLGKEIALKAIEEWGQPISKITHLVFCTMTGINMPSADYQLTKLLGLNTPINRYMIYQQGCHADRTTLHLANDLVENNASAHVLVVCSENTTMLFNGPSETHLDILVGQAIFADGAATIIIGANLDKSTKHPLLEIALAR